MNNTIKRFRIIVLTVVIGFSIAGCLSFLMPLAFPQTGTWSVVWKGASDNMPGKMVIEQVNGNTFIGYFDWYWGNNEYAGRETFTGNVDPGTNVVTINGDAITKIGTEEYKGFHLITGNYRGTINRSTLNIQGDGDKWSAVRGE